MEFSFNVGVEESIVSVRREQENMASINAAEKVSLKKASEYLDKGASFQIHLC